MLKKTAVFLSLIFILSFSCVFNGCKKPNEKVSSYNIEINLDGQTVRGSEEVIYFNSTETAISTLKFNLYGNAFRKDAKFSPISAQYISHAYPNGVNYGDMKINSVLVEGEQTEFLIAGQDENILLVPLKEEVFPDESVKVNVDFTLNLANVIARTGINDKTINLANFYPILCAWDREGFYECVYYSKGDPFYSDIANYTVKITADKDYIVASSGVKTSSVDNKNTLTQTYKINNARSFAFVLSKDFKVLSKEKNNTKIYYYYYEDENPEKTMEYAVKSIDYFSNTFGEYIYESYSFVQTKFVQGGMEFSALTMISDELNEKSFGEVIVHETAHQWWQTAVGNNEIEYGFLDEGLTEYSVILFYENHPEYSLSRESLVKSAEQTYKIFCSVSDKVFGKVDTKMIRNLKDFNGEYEYVNIAYIKPCIMYDTLRKTIGEKKFFNGLKDYYEKYKLKNATPYDLMGVYEKSGADTNGFFQSFFDGKVII